MFVLLFPCNIITKYHLYYHRESQYLYSFNVNSVYTSDKIQGMFTEKADTHSREVGMQLMRLRLMYRCVMHLVTCMV
jgi:hypothetical protein